MLQQQELLFDLCGAVVEGVHFLDSISSHLSRAVRPVTTFCDRFASRHFSLYGNARAGRSRRLHLRTARGEAAGVDARCRCATLIQAGEAAVHTTFAVAQAIGAAPSVGSACAFISDKDACNERTGRECNFQTRSHGKILRRRFGELCSLRHRVTRRRHGACRRCFGDRKCQPRYSRLTVGLLHRIRRRSP